MIRIAAALCFSMTLLCPLFCLAEADGGCCADRGQASGGNCEAMSVGAVVVEEEVAATPPGHRLPSLDVLGLAGFPVVGPCRGVQAAHWNRAHGKAPPSATRRALLQTFLF